MMYYNSRKSGLGEGLFDPSSLLDVKSQLNRYVSEVTSKYQAKAGVFLQQKSTINRVLYYAKDHRGEDPSKFDALISRAQYLLDRQSDLEKSTIETISRITQISKMTGDALDYAVAARDAYNLLINFNSLDTELSDHIQAVSALERDAAASGYVPGITFPTWVGPVAVVGGIALLLMLTRK